ncbi:response regulator [Sporosarcina thermotolerans]|uniref:response regulator transcription factor n=1 Tax=Sporosarcina thermotolerans TaxID=633404 RepID=UPI0024BC5CCF|nr:response regulator [Sporosarcina thermotolerans]WHT48193.1 response regulator [Sporosarcina thermotolerans]
MNILCVDDEPIVIEQLEFILKPAFPSWNLFLANDSIQAKSFMNSTYLHLAFLDIEMPGKSGLELAKDIISKQPHTQVVILSAHQDFSFAQKAIQIGVKEYLTKPIIESELIDVVLKLTPDTFLRNYSRVVNAAITYIQENYRSRISLNDIAEGIHVSPSYLSRKFSDEARRPL